MNYYEKIIQEKKNYKIFGMDGDQYESRHISEYARKFADGLKKGLISESQIVTNLIIDYGWGRKNAEKVAEEAKKIARHNSKEEKDNESVVERYAHNGAVIEIIKTDSGKFRSRISKKGKTEETMTVSGTRMEAKRDAEESADRLNSKKDNSKSYYQSIIEKKNANPEESMRKLQALKPIVEAFKRKGMTKHEVAMRLMQERDITETLAQQCVDTWY